MATTSIYGADQAGLAGSPVQRLLLATDLSGGRLPVNEDMLQELCALAGSDARRRRQRRLRWRPARHGGLRLSDDGVDSRRGRTFDRWSHAAGEAQGLTGLMETVRAAPDENVSSPAGWLPFLDTYRNMCMAPEPHFRRILEEVGKLPLLPNGCRTRPAGCLP